MTIRAALFDLDGTLVDSLADIGESMNIVLEDFGFPAHSLLDYRRFVGEGITVLARRALPATARDDATVVRCVERMRSIYATRARHHTRPYDGIPELLSALDGRGLKRAILSNKPHDLTRSLVVTLFGEGSFEPVFGERAGVPRKPDPSAALEAASVLGVAPGEVLFVGDTPTDLATACAAGMPAVAATWGFRDEPELRAAGATMVAHHPLDVLAWVK